MRTRGEAARNGVHGRGGRFSVRRLVRWCLRLVGLLVVVVLVVGIGVDVQAPSLAQPSYSVSEQAQLEAESRYRSLADASRVAASGDPDPAARELLLTIAADLEVQADAVALPRAPSPPPVPSTAPTAPSTSPAGIASGDASTATTPGAGATPVTPPIDGPQLLTQLRDSALTSLADAVDADPGPARVLASAGANQWQRALALGAVLGVDAGLPPPASATVSRATPQGEECAGTPLGSDADGQALRAARSAEEQARYGYEVAASLLPDRAALLERAAEHGTAADLASDRLVQLCRIPEPTTPGFALTPAFRADPLGELLRLEQQLVDLHAGHVPMTGPDTRAWAAHALTETVVRAADAGAKVQPLPGVMDVTDVLDATGVTGASSG